MEVHGSTMGREGGQFSAWAPLRCPYPVRVLPGRDTQDSPSAGPKCSLGSLHEGAQGGCSEQEKPFDHRGRDRAR